MAAESVRVHLAESDSLLPMQATLCSLDTAGCPSRKSHLIAYFYTFQAPAEVQGQLAVALDPGADPSIPWPQRVRSTQDDPELAKWTHTDVLPGGQSLLAMPLDVWQRLDRRKYCKPLYAYQVHRLLGDKVPDGVGLEVTVQPKLGKQLVVWLSDNAELSDLKRLNLADLLLEKHGHMMPPGHRSDPAWGVAGASVFQPPTYGHPAFSPATMPPIAPTSSEQYFPIRITVLHDGENLQVPMWLASHFHHFMVQVLASLVAKWAPQHCARDVAKFSDYVKVQWKYVTSTPAPDKSQHASSYSATRGVVDMMAKTLGVTCIDSGAKAGSADTAIRNEMEAYRAMNAGATFTDGSRLLLVVASSDVDFNIAINSVIDSQLEVAVIAGRRYRVGTRGLRCVEHTAWEDWMQNFNASGYKSIFTAASSASHPPPAGHHAARVYPATLPATMPQPRSHPPTNPASRVSLGRKSGSLPSGSRHQDHVLLAKFDKLSKLAAKYLDACVNPALTELLGHLLDLDTDTVAGAIRVEPTRQLTSVEVLVHKDLYADESKLELCRAVVKDIHKNLQTDTARELKLEPWAFFHSDLIKQLRRCVYAQLNCSRDQAPGNGRPYSALFATCVAEPADAQRLVMESFLDITGEVLPGLQPCADTPGLMIVRLSPRQDNQYRSLHTKLTKTTQTLDTDVSFHQFRSYAQSWLRLKRFEAPPTSSVGLACPKLPLASAPHVIVEQQHMRQDIAALLATVRSECEFVSTGFNYHNAAHRELLQRQLAARKPSPHVHMEIDGLRVALRGISKYVDAEKRKLAEEYDTLIPLSETLAGLAAALQYPAFCVLRDKIASIAQSDGGENFACVLHTAAPSRIAAGVVLRQNIADVDFRPDWPADRECALSKIVAVCVEDRPNSGASRHIDDLLQTVQDLASAATATVSLPDSSRAAWLADPVAQAARLTDSFRLLFVQAMDDASQVQLVGEQVSVRHAADLIQRGEDKPAALAGTTAELNSVNITLPAGGLYHMLQTQPSLMEQLTSALPDGATVALADSENFQLTVCGPFGVVGAAQDVVHGVLDEIMERFVVEYIELDEAEVVEELQSSGLVDDMQVPGKEDEA